MKKFGLSDKLGYMFGDLGNDFFFILASSFLMIFYTKVLGIEGSIVGTLFLVARLLDAVTDVTMGRIVDTAKISKKGRFRPWIRRMAIPVVLSGILMFIPAAKNFPMALNSSIFMSPICCGAAFVTPPSISPMALWLPL